MARSSQWPHLLPWGVAPPGPSPALLPLPHPQQWHKCRKTQIEMDFQAQKWNSKHTLNSTTYSTLELLDNSIYLHKYAWNSNTSPHIFEVFPNNLCLQNVWCCFLKYLEVCGNEEGRWLAQSGMSGFPTLPLLHFNSSSFLGSIAFLGRGWQVADLESNG